MNIQHVQLDYILEQAGHVEVPIHLEIFKPNDFNVIFDRCVKRTEALEYKLNWLLGNNLGELTLLNNNKLRAVLIIRLNIERILIAS